MSDQMINNLINKTVYSEDKIKTEKRLTLMNNNLSELNKKVIFMEEEKGKTVTAIRDLVETTNKTSQDVQKINEAL